MRGRYLGLKFLIRGKVHYGWARLNVTVGNSKITATLTGYAYETIPNNPIIAGKTKGPDEATVQELNAALNLPIPEPATRAYSRWAHPDCPYGDGKSQRLLSGKAARSSLWPVILSVPCPTVL